jgi:diguanylate cyclase
MKLKLHLSLLITMLFSGLAYGLLYHYTIMPLLYGELVHCIVSGMIFGLINYFISIAIYKRFYELKKVNKALKKSIHVDKLTALLNRRAFDNDMLKISKSDTYSLIFIDIDNFRRFNNEFGHKVGDMVLQKVSRTIKDTIRSSDRVYRYGGEEFVILLKDCDKSNALSIAEKIRIKISEIDNSPFPSITVSLGVASYPDDGTNFSEVIVASDKALLTAKKSGKNRTCVYNDAQDTVCSNY